MTPFLFTVTDGLEFCVHPVLCAHCHLCQGGCAFCVGNVTVRFVDKSLWPEKN